MSQNLRPVQNEIRMQSTNHSQSTSLSAGHGNAALETIETDEFLEDMLLVVAYSFTASSYQPSKGEKTATAKIWARLLRPIIPADRLMDTFDECFAEHDNSRALNAYDLKNKWQEIQKREAAEAQESEALEKEQNASAHCPEKHNHRAPDDAVQEYGRMGEFHWLPCHACRWEAHQKRQAEIIAQKPELQMVSSIIDDITLIAGGKAMPQNVQFKRGVEDAA